MQNGDRIETGENDPELRRADLRVSCRQIAQGVRHSSRVGCGGEHQDVGQRQPRSGVPKGVVDRAARFDSACHRFQPGGRSAGAARRA